MTAQPHTHAMTPPMAGSILHFQSTVPRSTVHRASVAEVFLTDSAIAGEDTFEVAAQLPRRHFMNENASVYDLMLAVEVVRQAGVLVAHRYYFVPLDMQFIFERLVLSTVRLERLAIGPRPAQVVISMVVSPAMTRNNRLRGLDFHGSVTIDGRAAFRGEGGLRVLSQNGYQALRNRGRAARLTVVPPREPRLPLASPETVGRRDVDNVVITEPVTVSAAAVRASIVPDTNHPHMFDHQLDHLPGNLEIEACRQLAIAGTSRLHGVPADSLVATDVAANFGSFAELDLPTRVEAAIGAFDFDPAQGCHVAPTTIAVKQSGVQVATVEIQIAQWRQPTP